MIGAFGEGGQDGYEPRPHATHGVRGQLRGSSTFLPGPLGSAVALRGGTGAVWPCTDAATEQEPDDEADRPGRDDPELLVQP